MARRLLTGGTLVTPSGRTTADLIIDGELIEAVVEPGSDASVDERISVDGMLVFPGFIDPHVHSRDPGALQKEDFAHCTQASASGGVTTVLDMPNSIPAVVDASTLRERAAQHERTAFVDFGLWGLSTGLDNLEELPELFGEGAVAVKVFWGYYLDRATRALIYEPAGMAREELIDPPNVGDLLEVSRTVASLGGVLAAHCEENSILEAAARQLRGEVESYDDVLAVRPAVAEAVSVAIGTELALSTGCRFHVVHMASGRGVQLVRQAQEASAPVSAETCPHYLTLSDESYDEIGPIMKVFPPIRRKEDREELWRGLNDGTIVSVGSDHAPHTIEEKASGLSTAPAGTVAAETLVPVMLDAALQGRTTLERIAWVLAEGTARLYGLFPKKGALRPGADADIAVVDPHRERPVKGETLHSRQRYSPWEGRSLKGAPVLSLLRGEPVMRDGEPVGSPRGRFVRRRSPDDRT